MPIFRKSSFHSPMHAKESDLARFAHIKDPLRQKFAAMHASMDAQIGRVLDTLRKHKLEEKTLILFVSDNGGPTNANASRNTPLRGFKAQTWEGGIRVPTKARISTTWPATSANRTTWRRKSRLGSNNSRRRGTNGTLN